MNKEFYLYEDKAIVSDNDGVMSERDNCDNIDEVLQQENICEVIEDEIMAFEYAEAERNSDPGFEKYGTFVFVFALIGTYIPIIEYIVTKGVSSVGEILKLFGTSFLVAPLLSFPFSLRDWLKQRSFDRSQEFLRNRIEKLYAKAYEEQKKLLEIKSKSKKTKLEAKPSVICSINDNEVNKIYKDGYNTFDIARNTSKYYRYYTKGLLEKKLGKEKAEEYAKLIEESGPSLVKKIK